MARITFSSIKRLFRKENPSEAIVELSANPRKEGKLTPKLKRVAPFNIEMQMDNWRRAITAAEYPDFPDRLLLYDLYRWTMKDAHLKSQIETGKKKVAAEAFQLVDTKTGKASKEHTRLLQRIWFDMYIRLFLDADFWGHSLIEFMSMSEGKTKLMSQEFHEVKLIPREHVRPEWGQVLIYPYDREGLPYRKGPFTKWLMEAGDPSNLGLLQIAAREVIWKTYSRSDWSRRSERYGMPIAIMKTTESREAELDRKEQWLSNLGANGYAIFDSEDDLELKESTQSQAYQMYQHLSEFCNEEISKLINGQTMTAEDGSSLSQSEVHERILNVYTIDRMRKLMYHINEALFPFLIRHGYPFEGYEFQYLRFIDEIDDKDSTRDDPPPPTPKAPTTPKQEKPDKANFNMPESQPHLFGGIDEEVRLFYEGHGCDVETIDLRPDKDFKDIIEGIAKLIYAGTLPESQLDETLYTKIADIIWTSWKDNYKQINNASFDMLDSQFISKIKGNIYAFSGAKTFTEMKVLRDALVREGNVIPWTEFREIALQMNADYNEHYLAIERNHAIRSATLASKWQDIQKDKDLFPYLRYDTVGDERVRHEHRILEDIILPVDDKFWKEYYPPNGWGCRCSVTQLSMAEIQSKKLQVSDSSMAEASGRDAIDSTYFANNPGMEGIIYQNDHPYYKTLPEKATELEAVRNYGMRSINRIYADQTKLPNKPTKNKVKEEVISFGGIKIKTPDQISSDIISDANEVYVQQDHTMRFIKYYEEEPIYIDIDATMEAKPAKRLDGEKYRSGILIFRK